MKKFIVLMLCVSMLPVSVFAADVSINTTATLDAKLGTVWGYDFVTNQSGFREIIRLDFKWGVTGFGSYASDIEGIDVLNEPYGYAEVSGLDLNFNVLNQDGDFAASDQDPDGANFMDPQFTINYENIYGQINFYPYYLLIAAGTTHYDRVGVYNFRASREAIRSNWAFMDYRFQHGNKWYGRILTSPVSSGYWNLGGDLAWVSPNHAGYADMLKNQRSSAMVGLGLTAGETEMMLAVGSPSDWTANVDNNYDIGFSLETPVIENLTLQAGVQSGINYENLPLEFGARAQYRQALDDTFTLLPYVAVDGAFGGAFEQLALEQVAGIAIEWPGQSGFGFNKLQGEVGNLFSGLSIGVTNWSPDVLADDVTLVTSAAISVVDVTAGGLVPGLGVIGVLEIADILEAVADRVVHYAVYVDYDLDGIVPFARVHNSVGLPWDSFNPDFNTNLDLGVDLSLIPNTAMRAQFTTNAINDFANATSKEFTFEVTVGL